MLGKKEVTERRKPQMDDIEEKEDNVNWKGNHYIALCVGLAFKGAMDLLCDRICNECVWLFHFMYIRRGVCLTYSIYTVLISSFLY